jgi:hypothetical protein
MKNFLEFLGFLVSVLVSMFFPFLISVVIMIIIIWLFDISLLL